MFAETARHRLNMIMTTVDEKTSQGHQTQTPYIDLFLLHEQETPHTQGRGCVGAFELKAEGFRA